ncbi:hypothetical protein ACOMHN_013197 [Nucella lapillus]
MGAGEYSASLLERQYPSTSLLLDGVSATLLMEGGHSPTTLSQEEGEEEVSSSTNPLFLEGEHRSSSLSLEGEHPSCTLLLAAENAATPGAKRVCSTTPGLAPEEGAFSTSPLPDPVTPQAAQVHQQWMGPRGGSSRFLVITHRPDPQQTRGKSPAIAQILNRPAGEVPIPPSVRVRRRTHTNRRPPGPTWRRG